jgi:hypothetical protein
MLTRPCLSPFDVPSLPSLSSPLHLQICLARFKPSQHAVVLPTCLHMSVSPSVTLSLFLSTVLTLNEQPPKQLPRRLRPLLVPPLTRLSGL